MLGHVFARFVDKSPISVMVRATLERVLGADRLDLWYQRTAQKQDTRALLFSTVYDLLSHVVFCLQPSVRAASRAQAADVGTSIISVQNQLKGLETPTSSELVRSSARELAPLIAPMDSERAPWLEGYRVTIVDGHGLAAREPRIQGLREATGRAVPGKALGGYEPAQGLVTDVWPCEDGHAQERSPLGSVLHSVRKEDRWIADRHFCPRAFLREIDSRGGVFVIREPQGVPCEMIRSLRTCGRTPTGQLAEQHVRVVDAQGHTHVWRRLRIKLHHATRDGGTRLSILTNFPRQVAAHQVAQLYQNRWQWETAFQHVEAYFHSAINTLGYPKAAWCGLCLALVASNVLAVVWAALRGVHGEDKVDHEVSLYDIAQELSTTYTGMMMAIPEPEWNIFYATHTVDLAEILLDLARRVRLQALRNSSRALTKPSPQGKKAPRKGHVATAKLLMNRKANADTP